MKTRSRPLAILIALATVAGATFVSIPAAHATAAQQLTLPINTSTSNPNGMAMDALNWGGTGGGADRCTAAVVNAQVGVYKASSAGCAADFLVVPVTVGATSPVLSGNNQGPFELVYAPDDIVITDPVAAPHGYCVSTVTDVQGAFARLRGCAATLNSGDTAASETVNNMWQNFWQFGVTIPVTDINGAVILQAQTEPVPGVSPITGHTGFCLNDRAFGGNQSPVISWPPTTGENQVWLIH